MVKKKIIYENIVLPQNEARVSYVVVQKYMRVLGEIIPSLKILLIVKNFIFDKVVIAALICAAVLGYFTYALNGVFIVGALFFVLVACAAVFLNHRVAMFLLRGSDGLI